MKYLDKLETKRKTVLTCSSGSKYDKKVEILNHFVSFAETNFFNDLTALNALMSNFTKECIFI